MNHAEAAHVLSVMASPHPWDVDDDQAQVWFDAALERADYTIGLDVALRLVETEERFPTPAAFNKCRAGIERERYLAEKADDRQQSLPGVPTSDDVKRTALADMRAALAVLSLPGARGHNHFGPAPCPVCGGMAPDAVARLDPEQRMVYETGLAQRKARVNL